MSDESWGDWRPHAAIILSNTSAKPDQDRRTLIQLGKFAKGTSWNMNNSLHEFNLVILSLCEVVIEITRIYFHLCLYGKKYIYNFLHI